MSDQQLSEHGEDQENELSLEMIPIERLQDVGINQADITKMRQQGLATIRAVQMTTTRNLLKIKGFSDAKVEKIKESANKLLKQGFITATQLEHRRKSVVKISTGSADFDKLLGGGIQTYSITEAFGEFRVWKAYLDRKDPVGTHPLRVGANACQHGRRRW